MKQNETVAFDVNARSRKNLCDNLDILMMLNGVRVQKGTYTVSITKLPIEKDTNESPDHPA